MLFFKEFKDISVFFKDLRQKIETLNLRQDPGSTPVILFYFSGTNLVANGSNGSNEFSDTEPEDEDQPSVVTTPQVLNEVSYLT